MSAKAKTSDPLISNYITWYNKTHFKVAWKRENIFRRQVYICFLTYSETCAVRSYYIKKFSSINFVLH